MAKPAKTNTVNAALVNTIAPLALKFDKIGFDMGEMHCVGMSATRYPAKAGFEWLTEPCNLNNTFSSITYTPEDNPEEILRAIGNTVSTNSLVAQGITNSDPVEQQRAIKIVDDGTRIIDQIANNNESVGYMSMNLLAIGSNRTDAQMKAKSAKSKFSGRMFTASILPFMQKDIFAAASPCATVPKLLSDATNQLVPISTLLGGFPFAFAGYNDGIGVYFGKDSTGSLIIVDLWRRGQDRNNSNLVCMGVSGAGKSTALKHLILSEWELGTKFVIIDPHGEYKELCMNLDGDWIDAVGGTGGRINPFHIYMKTENPDEQCDNKKKLGDLAKHINNLEVFFKLYLDLPTTLVAVLKECIEIAYSDKGITWDTDIRKIHADGFPVMLDLYEVCKRKSAEIDDSLKRAEENHYKQLSLLIRNIAKGSDSFIWNGASTVNTKKDFVVFDTSAVNSNADNIKTTLYHTVLNYCEDYLYRNRNERVILVCDEAHNVIDKRLPATLARLANIEKSCRKFESALWICSQQLIDFLDEQIKKEGQALLEQPNIKLMMPVGKGRDLRELKELYNLTDAEEERLMQQQRGKGLLFVGSRRLTVDFEIPQHRFEDMGTGGGR